MRRLYHTGPRRSSCGSVASAARAATSAISFASGTSPASSAAAASATTGTGPTAPKTMRASTQRPASSVRTSTDAFATGLFSGEPTVNLAWQPYVPGSGWGTVISVSSSPGSRAVS